ncbi:MAG: tetratricopeptide repeat protein [Planctomycetes bacterium]|nr:tetratricopeptide repeat protein [Planctomycetota bacterium]
MAPASTSKRNMIPLPRPHVIGRLLQVLAVLWLIAAVVLCTYEMLQDTGVPDAAMKGPVAREVLWAKTQKCIQPMLVGVTVAGLLWAASLMVRYHYNTALNIRLAERRHLEREAGAGAESPGVETELARQMVVLLQEINENSLLGTEERARKRSHLADQRRGTMYAEIQQLIKATKWPLARQRIDDYRAAFGEGEEAARLAHQLETAMKEHRDVDIMSTSEQIRSYMTLGLWDKARQTSEQLAAKYPDNPEAQKMEHVVLMEEEEHKKEDRLRLYREIEHLVNRKHYRDAKKTGEVLLERYPDSPEAATLKGQMDELSRNADIETRREMETQIIEYTKQNRHREAYELAAMLMEQYPESPQALALADTIDRLREKAGIG